MKTVKFFKFFSRTIFSGFTKKRLFITTCIEKHCTWSITACMQTEDILDFVENI